MVYLFLLKKGETEVPPLMFTQRNNPYCVFHSNCTAKVLLFLELHKYFYKNFVICGIFCTFAPDLVIEIPDKQLWQASGSFQTVVYSIQIWSLKYLINN